jgi:hypothetical protein
MALELKRAERKQAKIRLGLSGASGFGKTYSALLIAKGLVGDWGKIAMIDTEHGSGELYSDLGDYNVISLSPPFSPERYIEAIKTCEQAGMKCIIIDSITHEWDGPGGCLEIADQVTQASTSKNSYTAWAKVTPRHNAFVTAILQSSCHIITTVRRKQDYDMVKNGNKTEVVKVGMKEVTREGFEYELTINLEILTDTHYVKASKDRTGLFMGKQEFIPSEETGKTIRAWCESGAEIKAELKPLTPEMKIWAKVLEKILSGEKSIEDLKEFYIIREDHEELLKQSLIEASEREEVES